MQNPNKQNKPEQEKKAEQEKKSAHGNEPQEKQIQKDKNQQPKR